MKRSDGYTVHTTLPTVVLFAALVFLAGRGCAQDTRWRLIQGTDSIVAVPLHDLRIAAGYRIAKNVSQRQCAWELIERAKEIDGLRRAAKKSGEASKADQSTIALMGEQVTAHMLRADKWQKKAKRRNPVLWMGIGAGAMLLIQNALK